MTSIPMKPPSMRRPVTHNRGSCSRIGLTSTMPIAIKAMAATPIAAPRRCGSCRRRRASPLRRPRDQHHAGGDEQEADALEKVQALAEEGERQAQYEGTVEIPDHAHAPGADGIERGEIKGVGDCQADQAAEHAQRDLRPRHLWRVRRIEPQDDRQQHREHEQVLEEVEHQRRQHLAEPAVQDHARSPAHRAADGKEFADSDPHGSCSYPARAGKGFAIIAAFACRQRKYCR